jgi:hypothetical protein
MSLKINPDALFSQEGYLSIPIKMEGVPYAPIYVDQFDQNGYDLTKIEQLFCSKNGLHHSLRIPWMIQDPQPTSGPILNHCYLFERKGFKGQALKQLQIWAEDSPLYYKVINIAPKWGLEFSMDYVDREGNSFELLHYKYDCFTYEEAVRMKQIVEERVIKLDWEDVAQDLLLRKPEWFNLDVSEQNAWKCQYFNLPNEGFKKVC